MIVFLDFDGVVHPEPVQDPSHLFSRLPLIEEVLREFPGVEVVISSAWRLEYPDSDLAVRELRANFSHDIAPRVAGVTPDFAKRQETDSETKWSSHSRHWECEAWIREYRTPETRWMAMDDRANLFSPFTRNLMLFKRREAFTYGHQDKLRSYLTALVQGTPWPSFTDDDSTTRGKLER